MKKKIILMAICISSISLTGCGSITTVDKNTTNTLQTEVAQTDESSTGEWTIKGEATYDFPTYDVIFDTADFGITVGRAGEIHYTDDGGATWSRADNESVCRYGLDIIEGGICYTCGYQGVVTKSTDNGKSFTAKNSFTLTRGNITRFLDENNGFIVTDKKIGITTDGAETWKEIETEMNVIAFYPESIDNFWYIGKNLQLYHTTDGGKNWSNFALDLPLQDDYQDKLEKIVFTINGEKNYTIYCQQKSTKLLKSYTTIDGGQTYAENTIPELEVTGEIKLNHSGNVLTVYQPGKKSITILGR